jgi:hypothetical protein
MNYQADVFLESAKVIFLQFHLFQRTLIFM